MEEELKILAEQINFKELAFAKFKLMYSDKDLNITIGKGSKFLVITYIKGLDLYKIEKIKTKGFSIAESKKEDNIYAEDLKQIIQDFFNFEYVMDRLLSCGS